jgi:hypothetical protein
MRSRERVAAAQEKRMTAADPAEAIELRVDNIAQLFHTLDPFPFRERDLDREAEEYIVGWARELPREQPIKIIVYLPAEEARGNAAKELGQSFRRYFSYRADMQQRDLTELLRVGRRSLGIGLPILVACLIVAHLASALWVDATYRRLVEESFLILGWVANWRPLEIFLYDWWPIARRRDLYRRLAKADVIARPSAE